MDPDSSSVLVFNFPKGSVFGIDKNSWFTGPHFRGVNNIPIGVHFVFYSAADIKGHTSIRKGFFQYFKKHEIYPIVWDIENEDITLDLDEDESERLKNSWEDNKQCTITYPADTNYEWHRLTYFITVDTLLRVGMARQRLFLGPEYNISYSKMDKETRAEKILRLQLNEEIKEESITFKFIEIPKHLYPLNSSLSEISKHSIDKSYTLENIVNTYKIDSGNHDNELVAELQLSFICFIIGGAYEGFEQWKAILILFCNCDKFILEHQELYSSFLDCLRHQMDHIPDELVADIKNPGNFLRLSLKQLFMALKSLQNISPSFLKKINLFRDNIKERLSLDLSLSDAKNDGKNLNYEEEEEEFKPLVVEENMSMF